MTIYKVKKFNRFERNYEEVFYLNKAKAESEVKRINDKYNNAVEKGDTGIHWADVIYSFARVEKVKVKE